MKKVRVLKEMPFTKVGKEMEVIDDSVEWCNHYYHGDNLNQLFKDGWLEWVEEEKSLLDNFNKIDNAESYSSLQCLKNKQKITVAKQHFLQVFDKAKNEEISRYTWTLKHEANIRKALEDA